MKIQVKEEKEPIDYVQEMDKRKTVDAEFRDMTNSWIIDSMENVKRRRGFDKHDPNNMVNKFT